MKLKRLGTVIITLGVLSLAIATEAEAAGGMGGGMGGGHFGGGMGADMGGHFANGLGGGMNSGGHIGGPPPMGGLPGSTVNHDLEGLRVNHDLGVMRTPPVNGNLPGETTPGLGCTAAMQSVSGC